MQPGLTLRLGAGDPLRSEEIHMNAQPHPALLRATPESQGVHSAGILAFLNSLEGAPFRMHSFMFLRHGRVIAEGWWKPFEPGLRRYCYSLSKSFTSTAVGLAVAEGLLGVDDPVTRFFPADLPAEVGANLAAMRVRDLLTMTAGHAEDTTPVIFTPGLDNWARAILALPVDGRPGTHFVYNSGASYLLAAIVQGLTGRTVLDYLTARLFEPLQITDAIWETCPRGINTGGWGLSLRTEDIARFGQLFLQRGRWNDAQVVPEAWVAAATAAQVPNDGQDRGQEPIDWRQGYGYQFWRCRHDAYRGDGAFGQYCIVLPEQDAVVAITSETADMQIILDRVWAHLLTAIASAGPLPPTVEAQQLPVRLAALALDPTPADASAQPAPEHLGRRYTLDANPLGLQSLTITAEADACRFALTDGRGEQQVVCGYGAWVTNRSSVAFLAPTMIHLGFGRPVQDPQVLAASAVWLDPHTVQMTWQFLETAHRETVTCRFEGEALFLEVRHSAAEPGSPFLTGHQTRFPGRAA
ncbi:MAG: beta-lactamase family protein [Anaerolineales bacterium]|nr:beta-lactamase family protein [Anaerolineales bacterium]